VRIFAIAAASQNILESKLTLRSFCTSDFVEGSKATFNHQLSLSSTATEKIANRFNVSPQFLSHILSEPDYWAPGEFETEDFNHNIHDLGETPRQLTSESPSPAADGESRHRILLSASSMGHPPSCHTMVHLYEPLRVNCLHNIFGCLWKQLQALSGD
jgi:hypothetical protein